MSPERERGGETYEARREEWARLCSSNGRILHPAPGNPKASLVLAYRQAVYYARGGVEAFVARGPVTHGHAETLSASPSPLHDS
jgi:hypothetical protein